MDRRTTLQFIKKTILLLLGAALLVWGHWSNDQYKERHGIDATSGATQMAD